MPERASVAIVGAGAAGLVTAITAGRALQAAGREPQVVVLDGARRLGAKILIAGGGRCNVTHDMVDESAFWGSSPAAIRKVLRRFDVARTVAFFAELGVELKREETGKLFPTTDSARTVLDALLGAAQRAGARLVHPFRVERIDALPAGGFAVRGAGRETQADRLVLATGGKSLPKSGSDGGGYALATSLGHAITPAVFPALVPLLLPERHFLRALSGVSANVALELRSASGKRLASFGGSLLCAHFGISGPVVLDASRCWIAARLADPDVALVVSFLPGETPATADRALLERPERSAGRFLRERGVAQRLAEALCAEARVDPSVPIGALAREPRRALARACSELVLPVAGDRGFTHAEATAGGVPLAELDLATMESRRRPGLYVVGELCDVDGRIGGYNFQWAWASGHVAGVALARAIEAQGRK